MAKKTVIKKYRVLRQLFHDGADYYPGNEITINTPALAGVLISMGDIAELEEEPEESVTDVSEDS